MENEEKFKKASGIVGIVSTVICAIVLAVIGTQHAEGFFFCVLIFVETLVAGLIGGYLGEKLMNWFFWSIFCESDNFEKMNPGEKFLMKVGVPAIIGSLFGSCILAAGVSFLIHGENSYFGSLLMRAVNKF